MKIASARPTSPTRFHQERLLRRGSRPTGGRKYQPISRYDARPTPSQPRYSVTKPLPSTRSSIDATKQVQVPEEAPPVSIRGHVADRVDVDQAADAGDQQHETSADSGSRRSPKSTCSSLTGIHEKQVQVLHPLVGRETRGVERTAPGPTRRPARSWRSRAGGPSRPCAGRRPAAPARPAPAARAAATPRSRTPAGREDRRRARGSEHRYSRHVRRTP